MKKGLRRQHSNDVLTEDIVNEHRPDEKGIATQPLYRPHRPRGTNTDLMKKGLRRPKAGKRGWYGRRTNTDLMKKGLRLLKVPPLLKAPPERTQT